MHDNTHSVLDLLHFTVSLLSSLDYDNAIIALVLGYPFTSDDLMFALFKKMSEALQW